MRADRVLRQEVDLLLVLKENSYQLYDHNEFTFDKAFLHSSVAVLSENLKKAEHDTSNEL